MSIHMGNCRSCALFTSHSLQYSSIAAINYLITKLTTNLSRCSHHLDKLRACMPYSYIIADFKLLLCGIK